ncbi:MAG: hypothetical protein O2923_10685 [Verrucomicrobia bacterium]|nr:hypothetical protein [Verrucomicrobiota bacterium]MDA1086496.1 hypothetical protein [Verrucomicrobiota bacterium]
MDKIWKWLMRANAKGVLACAVVGLIAVSAWWAWRELRPYVPKQEAVSLTGRREMVLGGDLGVMAYLRTQGMAGATQVPGNPFMSSDKPWHWALPVRRERLRIVVDGATPPIVAPVAEPPLRVRVEEPPPRVAVVPAGPVVPKVEMPPPPIPPKVTSIVLTYRGVFERPDGTVLALIQDSESTKSAFYQSGDEIFGVKLVDIATTNATVETLDGVNVGIFMSEPTRFVDGRHAN